jgi:hypothetical protein
MLSARPSKAVSGKSALIHHRPAIVYLLVADDDDDRK